MIGAAPLIAMSRARRLRQLCALLAAVVGLAGSPLASAQVFTLSVDKAPALGSIVLGTSTTTFTVSSAGAVTRDITTASAAVQVGSASATPLTVSLKCTTTSGGCAGKSVTFTLSESTVTGGGNVGRFICATGQGTMSASTSYSCGTAGTGSTATQPITVTNASGSPGSTYGWSAVIPLGVTYEVSSTAARGNATINFSCNTPSTFDTNDVVSCAEGPDLSSRLIRSLAVVKNTDLAFGKVVCPASGSSVITVSTAGARTITSGTATLVGTSTGLNAAFTLTGEGAQALTVTIPATVTLTKGADTLTVTTSNNLPGGTATQTLGSTLGTDATLSVKVGGTLTLSSTTATGSYSGTLRLTAAYQ